MSKEIKFFFWNLDGKLSSNNGHHVSFSWREHQTSLWKQKGHWLQKEENVRYIVNVLFLIIGVLIGIKQL